MSDHVEHKAGPIIRTVPALAGLVYAAAAAVQFLQAEVTFGAFGYTFNPAHAMLVSLAALVIVFASSETKNWSMYDGWEQATVGVAILIMVTQQYVPLVSTSIANNQPWAGAVAFMTGMVAWGVLAR